MDGQIRTTVHIHICDYYNILFYEAVITMNINRLTMNKIIPDPTVIAVDPLRHTFRMDDVFNPRRFNRLRTL